MTQEEAEAAAKKRIRTERILAAAEKELAKSRYETKVDNYLTALGVWGVEAGAGLTVASLIVSASGGKKRPTTEDEKSKST